MTPDAIAAQLAPADREAVLQEAARRSFSHFARHVTIRSDDPENPGLLRLRAYPYQVDLGTRWEARESMVILKARQIGCSVWLRAYAAWRAWAHGWAIGYYSRGDNEAREWLAGVEAILAALPPSWGAKPTGSSELLTVGTGSVRAFPATRSAGVGFTFQLVIADEAAHHQWAAENYDNYAPTFSAGGQYICLSTANPEIGSAGWFHGMWQGAEDGSLPYSPVFLPWSVRDGRDADWLDTERRKFRGSAHAFLANYPEDPEDAFQSPAGLVYGVGVDAVRIYDRALNVRPAAVSWGEMRWRVAAVDPGGSDPTGLIALGCEGSTGKMHVFDAVRLRGMVSAQDIAAQLGQWQALDAVVVDNAASGMVATLRALGFPAYPAQKDLAMGRGMVASVLRERLLTIDPGLKDLDEEFSSYWWVKRRDGQRGEMAQATHAGPGHHADLLDALRYGVVEAVRGAWQADSTPPPKRPRARNDWEERAQAAAMAEAARGNRRYGYG